MNPVSMEIFNKSLILMAQGMAGIFVVMAFFYGLILGLRKIFPQKEEE